MSDLILTLNSGSSSLKSGLFLASEGTCVGRLSLSGIGSAKTSCSFTGPLFGTTPQAPLPSCATSHEALHALLDRLESALPTGSLKAVGHRVVHGGDFAQAQLVTPQILETLTRLAPLAPLHQPFNLEAIARVAARHPTLPQIACFDTSFHATIPALHRLCPLPKEWRAAGVRRYGFHGLSYSFIRSRLRQLIPDFAHQRILIAHLGSGASLCALKNGESFDTSMGFSALDGLVMGTRTGSLDPGVILYLLQEGKLSAADLQDLLYHKSGLLGLSGLSADMKILLGSDGPEARQAVDFFCLRAAREAGGLISLMGGLDALIFTGGIGEHAAPIRAQITKGLSWTGAELQAETNETLPSDGAVRLSPPSSRVACWRIPTDEESVIAEETRARANGLIAKS